VSSVFGSDLGCDRIIDTHELKKAVHIGAAFG
jgi:hypothetical protein